MGSKRKKQQNLPRSMKKPAQTQQRAAASGSSMETASSGGSGKWTYTLDDGLGSVRGVIDDQLGVQASMEYDPYGNRIQQTGSSNMPYGYTGEITDPNELVYLRDRYYNPPTGTFTSLDPTEGSMNVPMSLNGYAYAHGNPINMVDPSGRSPVDTSFASRLNHMMQNNPAEFARMMNSGMCNPGPPFPPQPFGGGNCGMPTCPSGGYQDFMWPNNRCNDPLYRAVHPAECWHLHPEQRNALEDFLRWTVPILIVGATIAVTPIILWPVTATGTVAAAVGIGAGAVGFGWELMVNQGVGLGGRNQFDISGVDWTEVAKSTLNGLYIGGTATNTISFAGVYRYKLTDTFYSWVAATVPYVGGVVIDNLLNNRPLLDGLSFGSLASNSYYGTLLGGFNSVIGYVAPQVPISLPTVSYVGTGMIVSAVQNLLDGNISGSIATNPIGFLILGTSGSTNALAVQSPSWGVFLVTLANTLSELLNSSPKT